MPVTALVPCPGIDGESCADGALILPGRRGCNTCTSPRRERPDRQFELTVGEQMTRARKAAAEIATAEFERQRRWRR